MRGEPADTGLLQDALHGFYPAGTRPRAGASGNLLAAGRRQSGRADKAREAGLGPFFDVDEEGGRST